MFHDTPFDTNLLQLRSTNHKVNFQTLDLFWWGRCPLQNKKKNVNILDQFVFQKCLNLHQRWGIG